MMETMNKRKIKRKQGKRPRELELFLLKIRKNWMK